MYSRILTCAVSSAVLLMSVAGPAEAWAAAPDTTVLPSMRLPATPQNALRLPDQTVRMEMRRHLAASSLIAMPYIWSAECGSDGSYALSGYVPADTTRTDLEARAGAISSDTLEIAGGEPDNFDARALSALTALGKLEEGRASYNGTEWALAGRAASEADRQAALDALAVGDDTDSWRIAIDIGPASVATVRTDSKEAAEAAASETAPGPSGDAASEELLAEANTLATTAPQIPQPKAEAPGSGKDEGQAGQALPSDGRVADIPDTPTLADEPETPVVVTGQDEASKQLLSEAAAMAAEAPSIPAPESDEPLTVVGRDRASEDFLSAASGIAGSAPAIDVSKVETPAIVETAPESGQGAEPVPPRYRFAASKPEDGPISLSGDVPAEATRSYFGVIAGLVPTDGLSTVQPAPEGFVNQATVGLRALGDLQNGELLHEYGKWRLTGTAMDDPTRAGIEASIAALPDAASWTTDIGLVPAIVICRKHVETLAADNRILFNAGSARLTDDSREAVDRLAGYLEECPDTDVYVEGHTDADGPEDMNMALSVARAEAVTAALVERGIEPDRLYSVGYGETLPIAANTTPEGKSRNRRIAFKIEERQD